MDTCTTVRQIADLHHEMAKDFTGKMVLQKKSSILSKPVVQCVDYIYSHIKERITVAMLAEYTGLSESYLSRVFKQNLGISISDYIREKKIEKATHLLRYSDQVHHRHCQLPFLFFAEPLYPDVRELYRYDSQKIPQ